MLRLTQEQFVNYGGLTPVNCGTLFQTDDAMLVEVLGPTYSSHPCNMVVLYAKEGALKVSLVFDGTDKYYVYRFKTWDSTQHYRSQGFEVSKVGKKYSELLRYAMNVYQRIFVR